MWRTPKAGSGAWGGPVPATANAEPPGRDWRLLLVEDSEEAVILTSRYFRQHAPTWRLDVATTLAGARAWLDAAAAPGAHGYDLVLLDNLLPDGVALDALRTLPGLGDRLPVIVVTADVDRVTAVELVKAGAADIVYKVEGYLPRLAALIETVVERARYDEERRRHERDIARLYGLTVELARVRSREELRRRVVEVGERAYGADHAEVLLFDAVAGPGVGLPAGQETLELPHFLEDLADTGQSDLQRLGTRALAALPLLTTDRVLGLLYLHYRQPRRFEVDERRLLQVYAAHAAALLEQAHLHEQSEIQRARAETLVAIGRALSATLDADELARIVVERLAQLVPGDRSAFAHYDARARTLTVRVRSVDGEVAVLPGIERSAEAIGLASVVETLKPLVVADMQTSQSEGEQRLAGAGMRARLAVPVVVDGVCRALLVTNSRQPGAYRAEHVELLEAIAAQLGLALRNADLYARAERAYQELQATQQQLIQSEKLRAAGQLAHGVAHNHNNMLAVILGHTELALQATDHPRVRASLEQIRQAAEESVATVRRLQDYARVRRDDAATELRPVDLNATIHETVDLTRPLWAAGEVQRRGFQIALQLDLAPRLPAVMATPTGLREMLVNLIFNAVDAMPTGGTITLRTADGPAGVVCEVVDTGYGMPPEVAARCFEPFFTTRDDGRAGLGLALVQSLSHRFGGSVAVRSGPGQGTSLRLTLRRAEAAPAADPPADPPTAATGTGTSTQRIVLVDDDAMVLHVVTQLLAVDGHEVHPFGDGLTALDWLASAGVAVDMLITDLGLPGLDGWAIARAAHAAHPDLRIGLLTGYGAEVDPAEAHRHGIAFVLTKPTRLPDLRAALRPPPAPDPPPPR